MKAHIFLWSGLLLLSALLGCQQPSTAELPFGKGGPTQEQFLAARVTSDEATIVFAQQAAQLDEQSAAMGGSDSQRGAWDKQDLEAAQMMLKLHEDELEAERDRVQWRGFVKATSQH